MKKKYLVIDVEAFEVAYKLNVVKLKKEKETHYELYSVNNTFICSCLCSGNGLIVPKIGGLQDYSKSLEYALCLAFSLDISSVGNYQLWEKV